MELGGISAEPNREDACSQMLIRFGCEPAPRAPCPPLQRSAGPCPHSPPQKEREGGDPEVPLLRGGVVVVGGWCHTEIQGVG